FPIRNGQRTFDPEGNSMFLITPPLLYLLWVWRQRDGFTLALLCGAIPLLAALLLFRATGYVQFGNRYLLDAMPLLLLLVATGMQGRVSAAAGVLIVAAIAMNIFGTLRFLPLQTAPVASRLTPTNLILVASALAVIWTAAWRRSAWVRTHLGGYE
ncbi:MAG TPA: hypothetical protein PLC79_00155, partial [Phycisphaerae bacterium]|nr:hypothetical protein [Phycisphaerae bacterium]